MHLSERGKKRGHGGLRRGAAHEVREAGVEVGQALQERVQVLSHEPAHQDQTDQSQS